MAQFLLFLPLLVLISSILLFYSHGTRPNISIYDAKKLKIFHTHTEPQIGSGTRGNNSNVNAMFVLLHRIVLILFSVLLCKQKYLIKCLLRASNDGLELGKGFGLVPVTVIYHADKNAQLSHTHTQRQTPPLVWGGGLSRRLELFTPIV